MAKHTYRVVVVRDDMPGFRGASGVYSTHEGAYRALKDIARTWEGLATPLWDTPLGLVPSLSFTVRPKGMAVQTYSILQERA
jgi:ABC-type cobalt transport system substrate-binding protein